MRRSRSHRENPSPCANMSTISLGGGNFSARRAGMTDDVSGIGYTPEYLAKFGKVAASKRNPMRFFPRAMKPGVVMIGDDFMGMIMPVRLYGDTIRGTMPRGLVLIAGKRLRRPRL